jgi:hypothetical protein
MNEKDIGLKFDPLGKREMDTGGLTLLQKITDVLEAAGIGVSGIETWPPEEDGRISVSMTIRPRPEPKPDPAETALEDFIDRYLEYDPERCETASVVYDRYLSYIGPDFPDKVNIFRFHRIIRRHFEKNGKNVTLGQAGKPGGGVELCFFNVKLVDLAESALDAINAAAAPDDPPAVRDPCGECINPDCDACMVMSSTPIKLYTPEKAVDAMKKGRILRNEKGDKFYWSGQGQMAGFYREEKDGSSFFAGCLSGLYEEARYV